MANCASCDKSMGFADRANAKNYNGMCQSCAENSRRFKNDTITGKNPVPLEEGQQINQQIDSIILTTETATNLAITKRIEIVTAEVAFGMNVFKDLFAGVRNIVGGRSEAVQKTMRDSRRAALYELKKEAHAVGANAVVAIDLDYVELSGAGSMVMLVASGTAVRIEE